MHTITHTINPPSLGAGGWTKGPCMNPSFLIIGCLKHWLCILCTHSFSAGCQFDTIPCSWKDLQGVNHSSEIYCWILWLFKVPSSCWLWIFWIHIAGTPLSTVIILAGNILAPAAFQGCHCLVCAWCTSILPPADISNTALHTGGQSPLEITVALLYSSQGMKIQPFPILSLYIIVFCWIFESLSIKMLDTFLQWLENCFECLCRFHVIW